MSESPITNYTFSVTSAESYQGFPISKIKTRIQIAAEYGVCVRTLQRWIKKNRIKISSGALKPVHQLVLYQFFGLPGER